MIAVQNLVLGDLLAGVSGHAAHGCRQTGQGSAFDFVVWRVVADGGNQMIPLQLVRVLLRLRKCPGQLVFVLSVALIDSGFGRNVSCCGHHSQTFGTVGVSGEIGIAARYGAAVHEQLRSIGECVFDRIGIEVLIDHVTAIVTTTAGDGFHRPVILHPAAFIDVVDQEVTDRTATEPQKSVELLNLIVQRLGVFRHRRDGR